MESIIERLKNYLDTEKISALQFAKDTGIPQDRVYGWLRRKGNPKHADQLAIEKYISIGQTPKLEGVDMGKKKPDAEASGDIIPDPAIPGVYQRIIDELIESSKAQREISKALLEERQVIRHTAQGVAAHNSEIAAIRASLDEMRKDLAGTQEIVWGVQKFAVEQLAVVRKIPRKDAADLLDSAIAGSGIADRKGKKDGVGK